MPAKPTRTPRSRRLLWLGAELLVVFVGVFCAFLLDDYRTARRDAERERQTLQALHQHFSDLQHEFSDELPYMVTAVDTFEARYQRGERPRPFPLTFTGSNNTGMWEALLARSGDVLDPDFIVDVEDFNIYVRSAWDGAARLRSLSDDYIIPRLSAHLSTFYGEDDRFRPEYEWYLLGLLDLRSRMIGISTRLDRTSLRIDDALQAADND